MRELTGDLLEPMARTARLIEGHLKGILAHSCRGLTIVVIEGINRLCSAVKRQLCGYRTVEGLTAILYFFAGKLTLACC
jgi:transposase